jgi:phosphoserine phosphatase
MGDADKWLRSWNDTPTRHAIVGFVERVTDKDSPDHVAPAARIAVFDNDGTLWCEKPMPVELGFILRRLAEMADDDASLRERQPWKAARDKDYGWLAGTITKHYSGDESDVKVLMGGIVRAFAGMSVGDYEAAAREFLDAAPHPTLGRPMRLCTYAPMIELLRYLEANGFTNYIASGGDRDFMRPITDEAYGISSDRVIGSANGLGYVEDDLGGTLVYQAEMDFFDDGPMKPVRIWSRVGRQPILAGGNSNGDIPMLQYSCGAGGNGLRLLVNHDDDEREFSYAGGAEMSLEVAAKRGWTVISMKDDWSRVFADR